jgi:hypothetical protein
LNATEGEPGLIVVRVEIYSSLKVETSLCLVVLPSCFGSGVVCREREGKPIMESVEQLSQIPASATH